MPPTHPTGSFQVTGSSGSYPVSCHSSRAQSSATRGGNAPSILTNPSSRKSSTILSSIGPSSVTGPAPRIRFSTAPRFAVTATVLAVAGCAVARWPHPDERLATMAHGHDNDHGHGHGDRHHQGHRHDHTDVDWAEMAPLLESQAELFTSLYERAMTWLTDKQTEPGMIVDAGSGP